MWDRIEKRERKYQTSGDFSACLWNTLGLNRSFPGNFSNGTGTPKNDLGPRMRFGCVLLNAQDALECTGMRQRHSRVNFRQLSINFLLICGCLGSRRWRAMCFGVSSIHLLPVRASRSPCQTARLVQHGIDLRE